MARDRVDPAIGFQFRIEIDGIPLGAFRECTGLQSETTVFEIHEGGLNDHSHKRAGHTWHGPIALSRGLTLSVDLWEWREEVLRGIGDSRRSGDIVLCNEAGEEALRWTFLDGWPSRWEGPILQGKRSLLAIERIEIVHEGLLLRT